MFTGFQSSQINLLLAAPTLGRSPARLLRIDTPDARVDERKFSSLFDLSLLRSGTAFPVDDLVELARWGHFTRADRPWEQIGGL